jgi:hypothetical protein
MSQSVSRDCRTARSRVRAAPNGGSAPRRRNSSRPQRRVMRQRPGYRAARGCRGRHLGAIASRRRCAGPRVVARGPPPRQLEQRFAGRQVWQPDIEVASVLTSAHHAEGDDRADAQTLPARRTSQPNDSYRH